jgi:ABC-type uncharacterized transport system substrate-binding protein
LEGRNVAIEYRWADEQNDWLPALAANLVGRRVAVIATAGQVRGGTMRDHKYHAATYAPTRRGFFGGLACAAWPFAARAQQAVLPVVGFLSPGSSQSDTGRMSAVRRGLEESGYVKGGNVAIEYRGAEGQSVRLPALAADLVNRRVAVIVTIATPATLAAKAATATIPIIFNVGVDPVEVGLVTSLNRPGGNLTGVSNLAVELGACLRNS